MYNSLFQNEHIYRCLNNERGVFDFKYHLYVAKGLYVSVCTCLSASVQTPLHFHSSVIGVGWQLMWQAFKEHQNNQLKLERGRGSGIIWEMSFNLS